MPERALSRVQSYLLPPSLDDWTPAEHPVRFVAALIEGLADDDWVGMGIEPRPDPVGAPRYAPALLASVWVWGFMSGVRSARGLERACREQIPVRWLTGNQCPDHNTLWRFYQAHRTGMRALLTRSIRVAVAADLVDLALVAVDGTKLRADAAAERSLTTAGLRALLTRTETAIAALEAQNTGAASGPPALPAKLREQTTLREQVTAALAADQVAQRGAGKTNLTDPDATLMKGRQGIAPSYNAQAAVAATSATAQALLGAAAPAGRFVVAATVTPQANDVQELVPVLTAAVTELGQAPDLTVADAGYHSAAALAQVDDAGYAVVVAEPRRGPEPAGPYAEQAFGYDATTDTLTCPTGQVLTFRRIAREAGRGDRRLYQGNPAVCRACPAFGECTRDTHHGRVVRRPVEHAAVVAQRQVRAGPAGQAAMRQRRGLIEGMFGTVKTCLAGRRVQLRGAAAVAAEWTLLATAVNLRTLHRIWCALDAAGRTTLLAGGGSLPATAHP
jgi:transposase